MVYIISPCSWVNKPLSLSCPTDTFTPSSPTPRLELLSSLPSVCTLVCVTETVKSLTRVRHCLQSEEVDVPVWTWDRPQTPGGCSGLSSLGVEGQWKVFFRAASDLPVRVAPPPLLPPPPTSRRGHGDLGCVLFTPHCEKFLSWEIEPWRTWQDKKITRIYNPRRLEFLLLLLSERWCTPPRHET